MPLSARATKDAATTTGWSARPCTCLTARSVAIVTTLVLLFLSRGKLVAQTPATSTRATSFHLLEATIDDVHTALRSGRTTCRELVELYLKRVAAYDKLGPRLNAVQAINPGALQEADRLDVAFKASGPVGALHCIPVLVKDQLETTDMPTTYGSAVFKDFVPLRDATVMTKLRKAGAVIIGKATMGEFASGIVTSVSAPTRNAYDPRRHASGSSGAPVQASPQTSPRSVSERTREARSAVLLRSVVWSASGPPYLSSVAMACSRHDPAPTPWVQWRAR
jgi:hypothetical protein